jgi:predicted acyl esterase
VKNLLPSLAALLAATVLSSAPSAAQNNGIDPPVDGNYLEYIDQSLNFTDGYVTLMDVRMPSVQPNAGGWPLVVYVHSSGTSRAQVNSKALRMAKRGYATVTYDVRGQGPAMSLNNGSIYGRAGLGLRERLDLFEVMEGAAAQFPGLIDLGRISVTGKSQGAVHSWIAAAHSGRIPPSNPWRTAPFPTITAVAPVNFIPNLIDAVLPGGQTATEMLIRDLYDPNSGIHQQPDFFSIADSFIRNEDYAGFSAAFSDPSLDLVGLLQTSDVHVMAFQVYDDKYAPANQLIDAWDSLVPNAQKVLNIGTSGHSTPFNAHENDIVEFRRDIWFDFHLKQVDNMVDRLPEFRFAITADDIGDYQASDSIWDLREYDNFPVANSNDQTWYLRRNGTLSSSAPSTSRAQEIQHQVDGNIQSIDDYIFKLPTPEKVEKEIALDKRVYETGSFPHDQLLIGEARVELTVDSNDDDFQVHAVLFDGSNGRYITGGSTTVRGHNGGQTSISIPLNFQSYLLRKGNTLILQLENLAWHRPPYPTAATVLQGLPIFSDFDVDVLIGGQNPSHLVLPIVPLGAPSLAADVVALSRSGNADFEFLIRADDSRAGWSYQLMSGSSGTVPGHFVGGVAVPLNRDWLTEKVEKNPQNLPITGFTGTLDGEGNATAEVLMSQIGGLRQSMKELDFVLILTSPQGDTQVSMPVILPIM